MTDRDDLIAIGFDCLSDGTTLRAPATSRITLTPTDGSYYRLEIALPHGGELVCVVPAAALKMIKPSDIDVDALLNIDPSSRRRPW